MTSETLHKEIEASHLDRERAAPLTAADVNVLALPMDDPRVRPLLDELAVEYQSRYANLFGSDSAAKELEKYPAHEFAAPGGALLIIQVDGESIAGGAFRRYSADTAEFKRIWTHSGYRRRGLGKLVLAELESAAAAVGYARVFLTTGPRQPEARALYLNTGYQALFDVNAAPESLPYLAFSKPLPPQL